MSARAAWRLETLGFERVYDYASGKADWLAHALPREGEAASVPNAGELVDADPPVCDLAERIADARAMLHSYRYGFCVVVNDFRIVLGRLRRSDLEAADRERLVEGVMEPGPSTVRPSIGARELVERLVEQGVKAAIVTTPEGLLVGVFDRANAERHLAELRA
jgi:CBS domain-containing protein